MSFASMNMVPFGLSVQRGNINNFTYREVFGAHTAITTAQKFALLESSTNNDLKYPPSAVTANIVSTDAADTSDGTGANSILIEGLDANYELQNELIVMNGTDDVATTKTYIRIFLMRVLSAGADGKNKGNIKAKMQTSSDGGENNDQPVLTEVCRISNDDGLENHSHHALFTVPAKHQAYLMKTRYYSANVNKTYLGKLQYRELNGVFRPVHIAEGFKEDLRVENAAPIIIPEKADIEMRAKNNDESGSVAVYGSFSIILEKL